MRLGSGTTSTRYQCSTKLHGHTGLSDFQKHVALNTIDGHVVTIDFVSCFRECLEGEEDNLMKDLLVSRYWCLDDEILIVFYSVFYTEITLANFFF